uniref:Tubulin--tyrosine ligase-like protein 9 n=1 Tax=Albugo laibachii Nc14 TaxID=890382 RepID=F0WIQ0_9STRA|nr:tubulin polyglutamylase putative [Albugo laibachii Nc14]|eukprot:CCA21141.1 tubulin polyglutamylase putative [Albugo laibachii Nc14]
METKPDAKSTARKSSLIVTESNVRRSIQSIEDARMRTTSLVKGQQIPRNASSIKFKTTFRNTIYDTMLRRGWKEAGTDALDWDFYWADREYVYELLDRAHLAPGQRVNHFRNVVPQGFTDKESQAGKTYSRKASQVCALCGPQVHIYTTTPRCRANDQGLYHHNALEKQLGNYDFFPMTYILPSEYAIFVEEFKKHQGVWIMKPTGKAQGKGIFLITKLNQINDWRGEHRTQGISPQVENYVVQRYVANPYLVGGKKFDMRLYALVPSFSPLEVYIYRGGFARFTNTRYSMNSTDISNTFIHLTNVAIQKTSENYNSQHGGKWDLHNLKCFMMAKHGVDRVDQLFYEIQCVIIKSLLSVEKIIINDKHCFELYGYDIMIDQNLKPWLLEVNASPSLSANTASDYQLKCGMLYEMLDIIDIENTKTATTEELNGFDLVFRNGYMQSVEASRHIWARAFNKIELNRNEMMQKRRELLQPEMVITRNA